MDSKEKQASATVAGLAVLSGAVPPAKEQKSLPKKRRLTGKERENLDKLKKEEKALQSEHHEQLRKVDAEWGRARAVVAGEVTEQVARVSRCRIEDKRQLDAKRAAAIREIEREYQESLSLLREKKHKSCADLEVCLDRKVEEIRKVFSEERARLMDEFNRRLKRIHIERERIVYSEPTEGNKNP